MLNRQEKKCCPRTTSFIIIIFNFVVFIFLFLIFPSFSFSSTFLFLSGSALTASFFFFFFATSPFLWLRMQQDPFGTFPSSEQPSFQAACHPQHCHSHLSQFLCIIANRQTRISCGLGVVLRRRERGQRRLFGWLKSLNFFWFPFWEE